ALSAITAAFAGLAGTGVRVAANVSNAAHARHAADAGVHLALSVLLGAPPQPDGDGVQRLQGRFEDAALAIEIRDEGGKVDLNLAPPRLLAAALGAAGAEPASIEPLVAAILDWRDADGQPQPQGAE